jgi:lipopolysaccharide biosynthesis protein
MVDIIVDRFMSNRSLGLVFAEDPYLSDWDDNREIASALAARLQIGTLPPFFEFPNGTMFWARSDALQPLCALELAWDDYPDEPVPTDGTILHALERLFPFAARAAGYQFATTFVPGVTR